MTTLRTAHRVKGPPVLDFPTPGNAISTYRSGCGKIGGYGTYGCDVPARGQHPIEHDGSGPGVVDCTTSPHVVRRFWGESPVLRENDGAFKQYLTLTADIRGNRQDARSGA